MIETRVVYLEPGKLRIETMALPELRPNQILVKTHQASVCGSERYYYRGITVQPEDEARGGPETRARRAHGSRPTRARLPDGAARPRGRRDGHRGWLRRRRIPGRGQGERRRPGRQPDLSHLQRLLGDRPDATCSRSQRASLSRWAASTSRWAARPGRRCTWASSWATRSPSTAWALPATSCCKARSSRGPHG